MTGFTNWNLVLGVPVDSHSTVDRQQAQTRREPEEIRRLPHPHRPPAMEKGKGLARRWAVELHDASSSSSSHSSIPDPPGFTRSAPDAVLPLLPPPVFRPTALFSSPSRLDRGIDSCALLASRRTTPPARGSGRIPRPRGRRR